MSKQHALHALWSAESPNAFLELNTLAEDLKVVAEVPGLEAVLDDLRRDESYASAKHAIHCAALFGRPATNKLKRFFSQTHELVPDFEFSYADNSIAVEAKILAKSNRQLEFEKFARRISAKLEKIVLHEDKIYPQVVT